MPYSLKYEWSENEERISIVVYIPGVSKKKIDILATRSFIKINTYQNSILIIDLYKEINDIESNAKIIDNKIIFNLIKIERGIWGTLLLLLPPPPPHLQHDNKSQQGIREEVLKRRQESIEAVYERNNVLKKERLEYLERIKKEEEERQMEKERLIRKKNEEKKKLEIEKERKDLNKWKKSLDLDLKEININNDESDYESEDEVGKDHEVYYGKAKWKSNNKVMNNKENMKECSVIKNNFINNKTIKNITLKQQPIRNINETLLVEFTELELPIIPARESREKEIREYKQSLHKDILIKDDSSLNGIEKENHLKLCKEKGDRLFKQNNYLGALNAYNQCIELDSELYMIYFDCAKCYKQLSNYKESINYCSMCIRQIQDNVDVLMKNQELLSEAYYYRGYSYKQLNNIQKAYDDYNKAYELNSLNKEVEIEIKEVKRLLYSEIINLGKDERNEEV